MGLQERAHDYQTKAFELRQRTSDRERLSIEAAYYADVRGEPQHAAQVYQELLVVVYGELARCVLASSVVGCTG